MKAIIRISGLLLVLMIFNACAVLSTEVTRQAEGQPPFNELLAHTENYLGRTVVLGGYVATVRNLPEKTQIVLVQAPLGPGQRPKSKDSSSGRLILDYKGFLDPEVYRKGRAVTAGGEVIGGAGTAGESEPFPYVRVKVQEIYLWPEELPLNMHPDDEFFWWGYYRTLWPPYYYYPWYRPYPSTVFRHY